MATTDIRFNRMDKEYLSLRESQGELMDKVDTFEVGLLGLTEAVNRNTDMLEAIIKHLDVPYKPPLCFSKELTACLTYTPGASNE